LPKYLLEQSGLLVYHCEVIYNAQVAEWSIATGCKPVALWAPGVQIPPCAHRFSFTFISKKLIIPNQEYPIMTMDKQYLTREKYDTLAKELDYLRTSRRKEVAENLEYAKKLGDLSENAEYHEARERQAEVEDRIRHLETNTAI
jgi:hypothetical protein